MGLFRRVSDIISANLNEMIERFEDPEKMLKQAIREMEASIGDARYEVIRSIASEKLVKKNLTENERQAQEWQERAEKAVKEGNDRLARRALVRKREHLKVAAALTDEAAATAEASLTLRRQLEAMQAKLAEAKRRLGTFSARKRAAEVRARLHLGVAEVEVGGKAFQKFDRLREKVERIEAEAEASRELDADFPFEDENGSGGEREETAIESELLELKKKWKQ